MRAPPFFSCRVLSCVAAAICLATPGFGLTVDGALDPEYGAALVTQTTQTSVSGFKTGEIDEEGFSGLDQGYATISDGALHLFLSGDLTFFWNIEGSTVWLPLDLFLDTGVPGQDVLLPNNPTYDAAYDMRKMAGLRFDTDFHASYWFSIGGNSYTWPKLQVHMAALPPAGGGPETYLGLASCGGTGALSGGTNPFGVLASLDDRDTSGIGFGCSASSGVGPSHGCEFSIPLAAIGNPVGCIKITAFVSYGDHSQIFNQVLGPVPPGICNLGPCSSVDFSAIPGPQYFSVCPAATATRDITWGRLKTFYR